LRVLGEVKYDFLEVLKSVHFSLIFGENPRGTAGDLRFALHETCPERSRRIHRTVGTHGDFVRNSLEKKPSIGYNIYLTNKPKACELQVKSKKLKEALCADEQARKWVNGTA
jgi:hypothetical protein